MCAAGGFVPPLLDPHTLRAGSVLKGLVDSVADFGVFVFLGNAQLGTFANEIGKVAPPLPSHACLKFGHLPIRVIAQTPNREKCFTKSRG